MLDEDVRPLLGQVLRQRGFDVIHVLDVDRTGLSDEAQLRFAVSENRAILTHNIKDFVRLDRQWRDKKMTHSGVLMSNQVAFRKLLNRTLKCLAYFTADSLNGQVVWLQQF